MQDTKSVIKQVRNIELSTKKLVDGLIAGNYHSIFKGQGIEFSDIREYNSGDDIRSIDWNVTARFDKPYIKEFIEERDLNIYFIFDFSGSNSFGNITDKKNKAIELAATLMFSAMRNNDNVGAFIFTESVEKFIPARKGRKHILKLISTLISYNPKNTTTNIEKSLSFVSNIVKKRSIIFILSDFHNQEFSKPLRILNKKHDIIAIKINDDREIKIPDVGMIRLEDEETGEQIIVDTSDEEFRKEYSKIILNEEKRIKEQFNKNKVDTINIQTNDDYFLPLKRFFKIRQSRGVK